MKIVKLRNRYYVIIVLTLVVCRIEAVRSFIGSTYTGWSINFVSLLLFIPLLKYFANSKNKVFQTYFVTMSLGFLFHCLLLFNSVYDNFLEVLNWIALLFVLTISIQFKSKILFLSAICFFVLNCGIAFTERLFEFRLVEYESEILESFIKTGDLSLQEFRSFALLGHPLTNACVTSLFMGFILANQQLSNTLKSILLAIGMLGLYGYNSRGAILVWIILILYRFTLYKKNFLKSIIPIIVCAIVFPILMDYINSGVLGRFSFNFNDGSSATRWLSFLFFVNQDWNIETAILGGRYIKMPGTDLLLENGILLNLSYWGWIVGALKTIFEVLMTYIFLKNRPKQEIFIIMFSFWGVALTNNIITGMLPLTFFLFAYSALGSTNIGTLVKYHR